MEVDLILDEHVVAADEAEAGVVEELVSVFYVRPKGLRVEVRRDGFDEDELVVPDQVQTGVLGHLDLTRVRPLVMQGRDVLVGRRLHKDVAHEGQETV